MPTDSNISKAQFDSLLNWLDADRERASEKYEAIRRRLIKFFSARGLSQAEDFADETIDRVALKASVIAKEYAGDPALYFHKVAQNVFRESLRKPHPYQPLLLTPLSGEESVEAEHICLEKCLQEIESKSRELVLRYYGQEGSARTEHRKQLAKELGIGLNELSMRVHRVRTALRQCVLNCMESGEAVRESLWTPEPAVTYRTSRPPREIGPSQKQSLAEAHNMRSLLGALINEDWLGLRSLCLLRASPRQVGELASEVGADTATLSAVVARLIESGAVEEREGVFFCTALGTETILKLETVTGISMRP